jgi:hypothetical protein
MQGHGLLFAGTAADAEKARNEAEYREATRMPSAYAGSAAAVVNI